MMTKRSIADEIDGLLGLKGLVETYEEVAAGRMQKVRLAVLTARDFLQGLSGVFIEVKANYNEQVTMLVRKKKGGRETKSSLNRNGKTVAVWISANAGLYGDIVEKTFSAFEAFVNENKPDVVVIGRLGVRQMTERMPQVLYNYFGLEDDRVGPEELGEIMRYLLQFEKILVFHGLFKSLVNQEAVTTPVSGDELYQPSSAEAPEGQAKHQYLFEPELAKVLQFFESQILVTLFEQAVHESQLAKFASRLMSLDRAVDNIDKRLAVMTLAGQRLRHTVAGKKQQGLMSGVSLWK
ncbi:MAG: F0F1 ATP synthase subunit gamma [Patescibacteria group bacterium]